MSLSKYRSILCILWLLLSLNVSAQTISVDMSKKKQIIQEVGINFEGYHGNGGSEVLKENLRNLLEVLPTTIVRIGLPVKDWERANDNDDADVIDWDGFDSSSEIANSFERMKLMKRDGKKIWLSIWDMADWNIVDNQKKTNRRIKSIDELVESICAYLLFAKKEYGVDVDYISINEPTIADETGYGGYNIGMTSSEQSELIKKGVKAFRKNNIHTRWIIAMHSIHKSEVNQVKEILDEVKDYAYAIDFHSYWLQKEDRLADIKALGKWAASISIPLFCGEMDYDNQFWKRDGNDKKNWITHGMQTGILYSTLYNESYSAASLPWYGNTPNGNYPYRYVALHYHSHIKPGYRIVDTKSDDKNVLAVAAYNRKDWVAIIQNCDSVAKTISVKGVKGKYANVIASYNNNYGILLPDMKIGKGGTLTLRLEPYSITSVGTNLDILPSVVTKDDFYKISKNDYLDRIKAMWLAQMIAVHEGWDFEHAPAAVREVKGYSPKRLKTILKNKAATIDDDWYYEMVALSGFEKYGIKMTVEELGQQWLDYGMGTWGSAFYTRQALLNGKRGAEAGHPLNNRMWFTVGNQNRSDLYAMMTPAMPNLTADISRYLGHINSYAEGTDGGVLMGVLESMAFYEKDTHRLLKTGLKVLSPDSPHRKCGEEIIKMAEAGKTWQECARYVEERWGTEYPATNSAVWNAGFAMIALWFGEGDFMKSVNIAWQASDFSDADCQAANVATIIAAMYGTKALPQDMTEPFNDRIKGDCLGFLKLREPVDMTITSLAERTMTVGLDLLKSNGATVKGNIISIPVQREIKAQKAETFHPNDFAKYWDSTWTLERSGFGAPGGGLRGIRGGTFLDDSVLVTYPRDEVRGVKLQTKRKISKNTKMTITAAADPGRKWLLTIYVDHDKIYKKVIDGGNPLVWEESPEEYPQPLLEYEASKQTRVYTNIDIDLSEYSGQEVTIRLYQSTLVRNGFPGNAYWKRITFSE